MNKELEEKINRFTDAVSKTNSQFLINFWNEVLQELNNEFFADASTSDKQLVEAEIYDLNLRLAKLQSYIYMINRSRCNNRFKFVSKFNPFDQFIKSPLYYDFVEKATKFEFSNEPKLIKLTGRNIRKKTGLIKQIMAN